MSGLASMSMSRVSMTGLSLSSVSDRDPSVVQTEAKANNAHLLQREQTNSNIHSISSSFISSANIRAPESHIISLPHHLHHARSSGRSLEFTLSKHIQQQSISAFKKRHLKPNPPTSEVQSQINSAHDANSTTQREADIAWPRLQPWRQSGGRRRAAAITPLHLEVGARAHQLRLQLQVEGVANHLRQERVREVERLRLRRRHRRRVGGEAMRTQMRQVPMGTGMERAGPGVGEELRRCKRVVVGAARGKEVMWTVMGYENWFVDCSLGLRQIIFSKPRSIKCSNSIGQNDTEYTCGSIASRPTSTESTRRASTS